MLPECFCHPLALERSLIKESADDGCIKVKTPVRGVGRIHVSDVDEDFSTDARSARSRCNSYMRSSSGNSSRTEAFNASYLLCEMRSSFASLSVSKMRNIVPMNSFQRLPDRARVRKPQEYRESSFGNQPCADMHGNVSEEGDLRLALPAGAVAGGSEGGVRVGGVSRLQARASQ